MSVSGNAIKPGFVIEHKGSLWVAVSAEHVKPGKGPAYAQVELKNLRDGTKLNERFRASETVQKVRLEEAKYKYLYEDGSFLVLMHEETYEQVSVPKALLGDAAKFLKEGMIVVLCSYEGEAVSLTLPDTEIFEIKEADPVVKGQTASSSYKPAILENGVRIMVPPHIEAGTKVIVNIADGTYVRRAE